MGVTRRTSNHVRMERPICADGYALLVLPRCRVYARHMPRARTAHSMRGAWCGECGCDGCARRAAVWGGNLASGDLATVVDAGYARGMVSYTPTDAPSHTHHACVVHARCTHQGKLAPTSCIRTNRGPTFRHARHAATAHATNGDMSIVGGLWLASSEYTRGRERHTSVRTRGYPHTRGVGVGSALRAEYLGRIRCVGGRWALCVGEIAIPHPRSNASDAV